MSFRKTLCEGNKELHCCNVVAQVAAFVQEDMLVAGGFDGEMYLFVRKQQQWQLSTALEGTAQNFAVYLSPSTGPIQSKLVAAGCTV